MEFFTDFADQAVMLPLFTLVALSLAASRWYRGLAAWLVAIGGVLALMALLKFVFFACGSVLGASGIHSPSGHTAAAAAVYGGGMVLLLRGRVPWPVLLGLPLLFAVLFGISRIAVHAHVPVEALAGGVVGLAGAALLLVLMGRRPTLHAGPIVAACVLVILVFHGLRLNAEAVIHHFVLFTWLPLPAVCRV